MIQRAAFDPFRVLSAEERQRHVDAYRSFLAERDGMPDVADRTMSVREGRMRRIEENPVVWSGPIDRAGFERAVSGNRSEELDPKTGWILAAARANEGESYGVELEMKRFLARGAFQGVPSGDVMTSVMMQESYHCRILQELCRTCGIDFAPRVPGWTNRMFIALIGVLPARVRWIPVMAGELVGAVVFRSLLDQVSMFADEPEVHERMSQLMREIWVDEVLHVAFLRSQLGPAALIAVRAMVPGVARGALHEVPQLRKLGCTTSGIVSELKRGIPIPDEVEWMRDESEVSTPELAPTVVS